MVTADLSRGVDVWARSVLGGHLARRGSPAGHVDASLTRYPRLAAYVDGLGLSPGRVVRVSVPQAVRAARKANRLRLRVWKRARLREILARARDPLNRKWTWTHILPRYRLARITLGAFEAEVSFHGGDGGRYVRSWAPVHAGHLLLRHVRELRPEGTGRSGLFPSIDACLREATADFLVQHRPESLEIVGADATRNAHNARAYASLGVPGYRYEAILDPASSRAPPEGVAAVRLARASDAMKPMAPLSGAMPKRAA